MQSLFLACYLCLQLIAFNRHDQAASSCDQCLTGLVEKFHLPSELADEVEDLLSIKKPTTEIVNNNPALADAIAKIIQGQVGAMTGSSGNETIANETVVNDTFTNETIGNETSANEIPADETPQQPQQPSVPLGSVAQSLVRPRQNPDPKSFLRINEKLWAREFLTSKNRMYLATLNQLGELVVSTADGTVLERLGCRRTISSRAYTMLFHQSNEVRFYDYGASENNYYCKSPFHCSDSVRCYLSLDDDGILRFYSGDGVFEYAYTNRGAQEYPFKSKGPEDSEDSEDSDYSSDSPESDEPEETEYKGQSTLERNQRLKVGESLVSENGKYKTTLNHYGELETYNSNRELIRNSGTCRTDRFPYSDEWNILMSSDNTWKLNTERNGYNSICVGGTRRGCTLKGGSQCHLKLDDDGVLKLFDNLGHIVQEFDENKLDRGNRGNRSNRRGWRL